MIQVHSACMVYPSRMFFPGKPSKKPLHPEPSFFLSRVRHVTNRWAILTLVRPDSKCLDVILCVKLAQARNETWQIVAQF
jgi:hypothetical protein